MHNPLHLVQYKMLWNMCTTQLRRDGNVSEQKFAEEIEGATVRNKMWRSVSKKAGWTANTVPTVINSWPNLVLLLRGVVTVINVYYSDKMEGLNNEIPPHKP